MRKSIDAYTLNAAKSTSCGCARADQMRSAKRTHGGSKDPLYRVWAAMKDRCTKPGDKSFMAYGGRGITVCREWEDDYSRFKADVGDRPSPKHSLDRKDNDGPYSPENFRWATPEEQASNRRNTHLVTYMGRTQGLWDWARELGVSASMLKTRLSRQGLSPEEAFTRPPRYKSRKQSTTL